MSFDHDGSELGEFDELRGVRIRSFWVLFDATRGKEEEVSLIDLGSIWFEGRRRLT